MLALTRLAEGLAVTHVSLLVFFLVGSVAFPWCDWENEGNKAPRLMMRVTCTCALGLSIVGLALFALGSLGWLTVPGIVAAVVVVFAAGCAAWRISPLELPFWRRRFTALARCWNWPLLTIYLASIVIGSRALIPDATGYSDAVYYHLPYAQDWANAHRLYVDPFLFYPFYANNYVLMYAAWMVLGAGAVVQFMTWLTALIGALALCATICDDSAPVASFWRDAIAAIVTLAVISPPIWLDYAVLGYIDVPIGAMTFISIAAMLLALRDRRLGWLAVSAVIAGFLIGMKLSFVLLVPVFGAALYWTGAIAGQSRRSAVVTLALLCAVAAPWYVRNTVLSGDPINPTINMAIYHRDGLWSQTEWTGLWSDLQTSKSPKAFLTLPARAFLYPTDPDFREYGASGLIVYLYVPAIVVLWLLARGRRIEPEIAITVFLLSVFAVYWFVTSSLLRYALLLYPLLGLCVAMLLFRLVAWRPKLVPVALLLAIFAALPNFTNYGTITEFTRNDLMGDIHVMLHYPGDRAYLEQNDDGYSEAEVAMDWMRAHGNGGNVYVLSDNAFDYYFRRAGITSMGTWIGPAGYFRLLQAIDAGEAAEFLADLNTRAVVLSKQQLLDSNIGYLFARQLTRAGYRRIDAENGYQVYVLGSNVTARSNVE